MKRKRLQLALQIVQPHALAYVRLAVVVHVVDVQINVQINVLVVLIHVLAVLAVVEDARVAQEAVLEIALVIAHHRHVGLLAVVRVKGDVPVVIILVGN